MKRLYPLLLLIYVATPGFSQSDTPVIDSLYLALEHEQDEIIRVDLLNEIAFRYYRISSDQQLEFSHRAYRLSNDLNYVKGKAVALKNIGIGQRISGSPLDSILHYYRRSLDIAIEYEFKDLELVLYNNIGRAYESYGRYRQGIDYLFKGLEVDTKYKEPSWTKVLILGNIGALYYSLKDYTKALKFLEESAELGIELNSEHINLIHIDHLALTKYKLGRTEDAKELIQKSLNKLIRSKDYESLYQSSIALIDIHLGEGEIEISQSLAAEMQKRLNQNNLITYRCKLFDRLAKIKLAQSNGEEAVAYAKQYLECAETNMSNIFKSDALNQLYRAYELTGDQTMMNSIHKEYVSTAQSEFDDRIDMLVGEEEYKYQNLLKQKEIDFLRAKEMESQRRLNLSVIGIISLLLFSGSTTYLFIRRNNIARKLASKNQVLTETEQVLAEKNQILEKYIESNIQLTQFAHIASHDLKSPLRTISSFIGLVKNSAKEKLDEHEIEYIDMSLDAAKDMFNLVEDLLSYSKVNALNLQLEEVDMKALLNEALHHLSYTIGETNADINICSDSKVIIGDKSKLRQVLENLLSNALKFTSEGVRPQINLSYENRENDFLFQISDNGIGIDQNYLSQVFEPFKQLNSKDEYSGTGLGLALCKEIIEKHKGIIWIESELGKGTDIFFTIRKGLESSDKMEKKMQTELMVSSI